MHLQQLRMPGQPLIDIATATPGSCADDVTLCTGNKISLATSGTHSVLNEIS
jgi:hypothetical protein